MRVVVCCPDLLFRGRILAAVQAKGGTVAAVRAEAMPAAATGADLVLVDLDAPGGRDAAAAAAATGIRTVGFGSHKDAEGLRAARAAGVDAMPRSAFVERLAELVA